MDAFFAAVEQRDDPRLRGKPVLVGGLASQRGVVAACSYEARPYGIHSAMPMAQALRRCPEAVVLGVRMSRYVEVSRQVRQVFADYTPDVEPVSIDEAFLDVTGCLGLFGSAEAIGRQVKAAIFRRTGLTASMGVAPNKFLAKLASDLDKPDGFVVITEATKQAILDPLPVSRIWGVGKMTDRELEKLGIRTIRQLRTAPRFKLAMVFKNHVDAILNLAQGIDHRQVETASETKSISSEETFAADIQDPHQLAAVLQQQVEEVAQRLRAERLTARTITLKLRYGDFRTVNRSTTLDHPTHTTELLWQAGRQVFERWHKQSGGPLRLLGFGASGLTAEGSGQQLLFADPEEEKQKKIDTALDRIHEKYGRDSLKRGE